MSVQQVIQHVKSFFQITFGVSSKIVAVEKEENGWSATAEIIEESEYMRSRALDDVIGLYQVRLDNSFQILSYQRILMRERDKIDPIEED